MEAMKNKLKELSHYCCKPANEQEYEFIKTCAKIGGVEFSTSIYEKYDPKKYPYIQLSHIEDGVLLSYDEKEDLELIPVTQFCDILLKDESEFDDRVHIESSMYSSKQNVRIIAKEITAREGYKFRLSEDCKTVELIKSEQ